MNKIIYIDADKEHASIINFMNFFKENEEVKKFINNEDFISYGRFRNFSENTWSFHNGWRQELSLPELLKKFKEFSENPRYTSDRINKEISKYVCCFYSEKIDIDIKNFSLEKKDFLIIVVVPNLSQKVSKLSKKRNFISNLK